MPTMWAVLLSRKVLSERGMCVLQVTSAHGCVTGSATHSSGSRRLRMCELGQVLDLLDERVDQELLNDRGSLAAEVGLAQGGL